MQLVTVPVLFGMYVQSTDCNFQSKDNIPVVDNKSLQF